MTASMRSVREPFGGHLLQGPKDQLLDLVGALRLAGLQAGGEIGGAVFVVVAAAGGEVAAEAGIEQGLVEGGRRVADKQGRKQAEGEALEAVADVAGQPADLDHGLGRQLLAGIEGVALGHPVGPGQADLRRHLAGDRCGSQCCRTRSSTTRKWSRSGRLP